MNPSQRTSSSSLLPAAARDSDSSSIRPRNRRQASARDDVDNSSSRPTSRGATPIPAAHIGSVTGRNDARQEVAWRSPNTKGSSGQGGGLLGSAWAPSWASVQNLATSLIASGESFINGESHRPETRNGTRAKGRQDGTRDDPSSNTWGPAPPSETRPRSDDIGAGTLAKRDARLKAMRTASVLESHEGVNGGLEFGRKFKKKGSDEDLRTTASNDETEEHLVYIHHVQPTDTYAGVVLKYRCREDAFRKANGLWSRDGLQVRKYLMMPVDACEVRGRTCAPPADPAAKVDLLARTPDTTDPWGQPTNGSVFFSNSANNNQLEQQSQSGDDDRPWTHVRWVSIDSHPHPVEVARVSRRSLGYFPPRRKKSIHTMSTISTPRASVDAPNLSVSEPNIGSPRSPSSRRPSLLRSPIASSHGTLPTRSNSTATTSDNDPRPAWMRRPGGVGSLGRNVRAPGPQKDPLNDWAKKNVPGFNFDSLPSMSAMGMERARFGFTNPGDANVPVTIAESPFREGQDTSAMSRQGTGLDKAALAVETWLRGAFEKGVELAKSGNVTPILGPRRVVSGMHGGNDGHGDLIELENTGSDDGRGMSRLGRCRARRWDFEVAFGHTFSLEYYALRERRKLSWRGQSFVVDCWMFSVTLWREGGGNSSSTGKPASGGGHNIRLTVCKNCGRFCDKYVEHDFVVLFIDLVLIKPQVYRHLLHNTLMNTPSSEPSDSSSSPKEDAFAPSIIRLGVLLLLFDVYLTWARIERQAHPSGEDPDGGGVGGGMEGLAQRPIVTQYIFFLILCTLTTLSFHTSIRFLTSSRFSPLSFLGILPRFPRPNSVSTALLVSSSTKLFPILMVIWEYDVPAAARSLGWAVVANNVEALKILLDCSYGVAAFLAMAGALSRWAMGRAVLWAAGLEGVDSWEGGGDSNDGRALGQLLVYLKDWAGRLAVG
ncbi:Arv1-like family-domain-containing protein [Apiosordaria backusii]|uniref:Protein ARV n=1 Tax=Apiosordaria backusii TaxID=314023 RepID=A0AA40BKB4_9PEZI|nr:Arv1-like family-domain-containing protein [Apiosordaria backusii]